MIFQSVLPTTSTRHYITSGQQLKGESRFLYHKYHKCHEKHRVSTLASRASKSINHQKPRQNSPMLMGKEKCTNRKACKASRPAKVSVRLIITDKWWSRRWRCTGSSQPSSGRVYLRQTRGRSQSCPKSQYLCCGLRGS